MKKRVLVLILPLMLLTLTGCWSKEEPNELASINSILYDIMDGGKSRVMLEILRPIPSNEDESKDTTSSLGPITVEGNSIREAIANLSRSTEKKIFAGHNKIRFLTERFAQEGMESLLEIVTRDMLLDETAILIVIKSGTPEEIFSIGLGLSDMAGDYFDDLVNLHDNNYTSSSTTVTTLDFIKDYYLEGKQPVIGVAQVIDKTGTSLKSEGSNSQGKNGDSDSRVNNADEMKYIVYEGLAAFKGLKLVGYMNDIETRAYNLVAKSVKYSLLPLPSGNGRTVIAIDDSKSDIKTSLENNQVFVRVNIKTALHIVEETGDLDASLNKHLRIAEMQVNELLQNQVESAIRKVQTEFKSDIFGFGRQVHIQHPDRWYDLRENWDEHFSEAIIEVVVDSSITRIGQTKKPITGGIDG